MRAFPLVVELEVDRVTKRTEPVARRRRGAVRLVVPAGRRRRVERALTAMRQFAAENPGRVGIFRMRYEYWRNGRYGKVLWEERELRLGNVSTQTFVVPNVPGKARPVGPGPLLGDWAFIQDTVGLQGDPVFCDTVVARIRPDRRPRPIRALDASLRLRPRLSAVDLRVGLRRKAGRLRAARRWISRGTRAAAR
jgi:hypothetical protein